MSVELLNIDCMEYMKGLEDNAFDLVLADPPYGTTANKWDSVIPLDDMWAELKRVAKDTAAFVFTASQPFSSALVMSNVEMFRHEWVWIKNRGSNFANTVREPMKEHEVILVFSKGKWTYNKQMQERTGGGAERVKYDFNTITESENYKKFEKPSDAKGKELRVPSSWQKFNVVAGEEKTIHPTQKPVSLFQYLVKTYSTEGERVLDFTMGSGTTAIACHREGRDFVGCELDEDYYKAACKRFDAETAQMGFDL